MRPLPAYTFLDAPEGRRSQEWRLIFRIGEGGRSRDVTGFTRSQLVGDVLGELLKVRSESIRMVKAAYDEAGISMPEPIQNVRTLAEAPTRLSRSPPDSASEPEMAEITDTTADHTIREKVHHIRASGEEDLLSQQAPRE